MTDQAEQTPREKPVEITVKAKWKAFSNQTKIKYSLFSGDTDKRLRNGIIWSHPNELLKIRFTLEEASDMGLGLEFDPIVGTPPTAAPIWMQPEADATGPCPPAFHIIPGFKIRDWTPLSFILKNRASAAGERFIYMLKISDSGRNPWPYDPVIQNGGGPPFIGFWQLVLPALIGLGALVGIAYAAGLFE